MAEEYLRQAAAIPIRGSKICLITSSNGKRWVIPKGLIDAGHTSSETALNEAWEEAGLVGVLAKEPLGTYIYTKLGGTYHVLVYMMRVTEVAEDWPEKGQRQRIWVNIERALEQIEDPGLRELIEAATTVLS
jgi:8-oxo-dGTP pyrophosphatase MutT (NUDIX family)